MVPVIDAYRCDGCNVCVLRCPPKVMGQTSEQTPHSSHRSVMMTAMFLTSPIGAVNFKLPDRVYAEKHDAYRAHPR